jgi:hypothetical protein
MQASSPAPLRRPLRTTSRSAARDFSSSTDAEVVLMTWMAALSLECVHGRSVHAAAHVALSAIRAITDAEGELFSHPNLGAEVPARAVPRSARAPTMARARRRSPSSPRRRDETPLKHGPRGKPAKCAVLRPAALLLNVLQISDVSHETPCNACVHVGRQRVPAKHEARQDGSGRDRGRKPGGSPWAESRRAPDHRCNPVRDPPTGGHAPCAG